MKKEFLTFVVVMVAVVFSIGGVFAAVNGANITPGDSSSASASTAGSHDALAGNVTELTITGYTNTQTWQGYYGNVSGTIQLADSSDNVMYNWSLADPQGEIYASENSSVNWPGTACYVNATSTATIEARFNISYDAADGIDETFNLQNHDEFYVNNIQISADTCMSTRIFGDTQAGVDGEFEEVLLTAGSGEFVFAAILESDMAGFDNGQHDFEMLVVEDGHGSDVTTTSYYFYVELE